MAEPIVLEQLATVSSSLEVQPAMRAAFVGDHRELLFFVTAEVQGDGTLTVGPQTSIEPTEELFVNAVSTESFLTFTSGGDKTKVLQLDRFGAYLRWSGWVSVAGTSGTFSVRLLLKEQDRW